MSVIGNPIIVGGGGSGDTFAFISVTYPAGSTCTVTNGTTTLTAPDTSGTVAFRIPTPVNLPESWTVSCSNGTDSTSAIVSITYEGQGEDVELEYVPLESFATVSDANFVKMIQAAHKGTINLQTDAGWKVGDKRTISISAFTGGGNVSHAAQSIDIAISSFADYENCGCVLQFDFVDELASGNRMEASNINTNGYGGSEMYKTTLPALVNALPEYLRGLLIPFSCKASAGNKSTTIKTVTGNKLALRSEVEIFGTTTYSAAGEGSQIPYYTTSANWGKKRGHSGSANYWWERSPRVSNTTNFCGVHSGGTSTHGAYSYNASMANGVAPFGCIGVPNVKIINFTVDVTTYQAEEGMTWGEWVNSSYNTGGFYIAVNYIMASSYYYVGHSVGHPVGRTEQINNGETYISDDSPV